jgi:SPP1 family predicted phage head-tail adaptor
MAGGIEAGLLRQRVTLMRPTTVTDSFGQSTRTWTDIATVWAQVVNNGGGTSLTANRTQITYQHSIRLRPSTTLSGIDATWRVRYKGRLMEISSLQEQQNLNALLELECAEERPQGGST